MSGPFKLRSGNNTPFKQMGSSPIKQIEGEKVNTPTYSFSSVVGMPKLPSKDQQDLKFDETPTRAEKINRYFQDPRGFVSDITPKSIPEALLGIGLVGKIPGVKKILSKLTRGSAKTLTEKGGKFTLRKQSKDDVIAWRLEDAKTKSTKRSSDYITGNWATKNKEDLMYYVNKTKKYGDPNKLLSKNDARRIMKINLDKKLWDKMSKGKPPEAQAWSKTSGEGIIPPPIMNEIRTGNTKYSEIYETKNKLETLRKLAE